MPTPIYVAAAPGRPFISKGRTENRPGCLVPASPPSPAGPAPGADSQRLGSDEVRHWQAFPASSNAIEISRLGGCLCPLSVSRQADEGSQGKRLLDQNACFCPELARLSVSLVVLAFYTASREDVNRNNPILGGSPPPPLARQLDLVLSPPATSPQSLLFLHTF